MLRTIAIALVLVLTASVMLPFANSAHGVRQAHKSVCAGIIAIIHAHGGVDIRLCVRNAPLLHWLTARQRSVNLRVFRLLTCLLIHWPIFPVFRICR